MNHTPYWHCATCKCEPEIGTIAVSNYLDAEVHTVCRTFVELRGREKEDEQFDVRITPRKRYDDEEQEYELMVTHNGYQWSGMTLTENEAYVLESRLAKFLTDIKNDTQITT